MRPGHGFVDEGGRTVVQWPPCHPKPQSTSLYGHDTLPDTLRCLAKACCQREMPGGAAWVGVNRAYSQLCSLLTGLLHSSPGGFPGEESSWELPTFLQELSTAEDSN